jgi:hypothetical protein
MARCLSKTQSIRNPDTLAIRHTLVSILVHTLSPKEKRDGPSYVLINKKMYVLIYVRIWT